MEFNFNINNYFKEEITKIGSRLIPDGFIGDRREIQDCLSKISYILTIIGEKSAKAQGLQKVITSGEKLRNSDHTVYLLVDPKGGSKGLGTVLGMLKMGVKHLYVFDAGGNSHEVTTKCILDFYVHESKQRMGLGKKIFQYMLKEERVDPVHLAIDKPSPKFISFLHKHYGLETIIPQMNNFVVFEGFFTNRPYGGTEDKDQILPAGVNSCGNRYTSGVSRVGSTSSPTPSYQHRQSSSAININNMSYYGRQAPHKPISTMGMILQQKPPPSQQPAQNGSSAERTSENDSSKTETAEPEDSKTPDEPDGNEGDENGDSETGKEVNEDPVEPDSLAEDVEEFEVEPKPEVDDNSNVSVPNSPNESTAKVSPEIEKGNKSRLNSQGHLDLKFYHSSLW